MTASYLSNDSGATVNLCGVDPGTNNLGFACLSIDVSSGKIVNAWATTLRVDKLPDCPGFVEGMQTERMEKLLKLKDAIKRLLTHYDPAHLSCESPFYNRLRPSAFEPLVESVMAVKLAVYEYDPKLKFDTLPPSIIKKQIGAGAISGKDSVRVAMMGNEELKPVMEEPMSDLDEHAIDSLAVVYSFWKLHFNKV